MKILTFPGGIHPGYHKSISIGEPLREPPLPDTAVIPLSQHIGAPNDALVKKGDQVEEADVLGESGSFISSPVHSSISGTVQDVVKAFHPSLGPVLSVIVKRDTEKAPKKYTKRDIDAFSAEDLIKEVKNAGIVGMGGAAFPTYVKFSVPEGKKIDTLIINGAECEPFLTCDHVLMTKKTKEILEGIEIITKILKPKETYIAVEDNKRAAYFAFQKLIESSKKESVSAIKLALLKTKYPQGGEKQIIKAISGREVPPGKLPLDIGFLVQNAGTVYAVYEAIHFNKPLIERIVTLSGDCIERPGNYLIRIGTTVKEIIEKYGVKLIKDPEKIIIGGPMMGFSQPGLEVPVLKSTSGILFLSEEYVKSHKEQECIRCAKCIDVCPVSLSPTDMMKSVKNKQWSKVKDQWVDDCMECGACAYSCPARIPLVQYIKEGKAAMRANKA